MNVLTENILRIDLSENILSNTFARLIEWGNEQGYIAYDDILILFPDAEQDVEFLDQILTAIQNEKIKFLDDEVSNKSTNQALGKSPQKTEVNTLKFIENDHLANIDVDDLIGLYFRDAVRSPLLTREEEVDLAMRIEQGILAREEISDMNLKSISRQEELQNLIDDSWTAVSHLITANSRLVISIAKKFSQRGVPFLDLIQEGNIGLMRAVKKFDYRRGYKFSTYATWWIRQAITRALADQSRTIRLPVHKTDQLSKLFRMKHTLKQRLGKDPSISEIAEALALTPETVQQLYKEAQFPISLEMPLSFDGESILGDFIEDQEMPSLEEATTSNLLHQHIFRILDSLPPREALILKLRYGLLTGESHTLREVGDKIGVSRERIRQIEVQAINRLRNSEIKSELRAYLNQI